MTETLDATEWLHASFHKVYPDQVKRIRQENGKYYSVESQNIFDYLYEKRLFGPAALSAAEFYFTLNEVATSKTGYAKMMRMLENQGIASGGDKIPGFCPNTLMMIISQQMGKWQYALVQRICLNPVGASDIGWINSLHHRIIEAFDDLGEAIEKSIDILKNRLNTSR